MAAMAAIAAMAAAATVVEIAKQQVGFERARRRAKETETLVEKEAAQRLRVWDVWEEHSMSKEEKNGRQLMIANQKDSAQIRTK